MSSSSLCVMYILFFFGLPLFLLSKIVMKICGLQEKKSPRIKLRVDPRLFSQLIRSSNLIFVPPDHWANIRWQLEEKGKIDSLKKKKSQPAVKRRRVFQISSERENMSLLCQADKHGEGKSILILLTGFSWSRQRERKKRVRCFP